MVFKFLNFAVGISWLCVVPGNCEEWVTYRNSQYKVSNSSSTWANALADCKSQGAYLAEVNSYCENRYIKELAQSVGNEDFWLGGHKADGVWKWATSNETFTENNGYWGSGEPNGSGSCLQMWKGIGHKWDDVYCWATQRHICERAVPGK